jgi:5,10-methylenetetrahydromethanopterin reductase
MRVYVRVSPFAPVQEVIEFTKLCEAAGFDGVGYLDSQMINRDVFVTMGLAAAATSRISLVSAVTNPISRHVSTIASAAATVDDLAPGRVEIWMGRGFTAVNLAGLPYASVKQLRESVVSLRGLLKGEWDAIPGVHTRMAMAGHGRDVPIILAAAGPRTLRLAGEVADGVILSGGLVPKHLESSRALVDEGARAAGRDAKDVTRWLNLLTCIRPTREEALRWAGPLLALRLEETEWLADAGIDTHGATLSKEFMSLYPDPMHAEDAELARDLSEQVPLALRMQIAAASGLIGSPDDVIQGLERAKSLGYDHVFMRTIDTMSFPAPEVEAYGRVIGPAVATMG